MDFSRAGAAEALAGAFRARVQWKQEGRLRVGPGPSRRTREAAGYRRRRVANRHVLAEGCMDKTLVSIPFPNTALAMYLLIGFP